MRNKTRKVTRLSSDSPHGLNISTAKRAADAFCAKMDLMDPQLEYIAELTGERPVPVHRVLVRHLMRLSENRPALYRVEAELLLIAVKNHPCWFIREPEDFARHVNEAFAQVLRRATYSDSVAARRILCRRLRNMSKLEIDSINDSVDQWWSSGGGCESFEGLELYFNLIAGRRVTWNG